jgi:hypothetical protein
LRETFLFRSSLYEISEKFSGPQKFFTLNIRTFQDSNFKYPNSSILFARTAHLERVNPEIRNGLRSMRE